MNFGPVPESYFERTGEGQYKPTALAGGAWSDGEMHFSPLAGLVAHVLERHLAERGGGLALSRISYDILGRLALDTCEVGVETLRPGRTIELTEATVRIDGRAVVRARAWFLAGGETASVADAPYEPVPGPEELPRWSMAEEWGGGYVSSVEVRRAPGSRRGRATAWVSSPAVLVAREPVGPLASYLALVDTANGVAVQQDPKEWIFPNVDLTVHLHRQPRGEWTGLDTTVTFGPTGQGLTSSVLHDTHGPVGTAEQILTVRPAPQG